MAERPTAPDEAASELPAYPVAPVSSDVTIDGVVSLIVAAGAVLGTAVFTYTGPLLDAPGEVIALRLVAVLSLACVDGLLVHHHRWRPGRPAPRRRNVACGVVLTSGAVVVALPRSSPTAVALTVVLALCHALAALLLFTPGPAEAAADGWDARLRHRFVETRRRRIGVAVCGVLAALGVTVIDRAGPPAPPASEEVAVADGARSMGDQVAEAVTLPPESWMCEDADAPVLALDREDRSRIAPALRHEGGETGCVAAVISTDVTGVSAVVHEQAGGRKWVTLWRRADGGGTGLDPDRAPQASTWWAGAYDASRAKELLRRYVFADRVECPAGGAIAPLLDEDGRLVAALASDDYHEWFPIGPELMPGFIERAMLTERFPMPAGSEQAGEGGLVQAVTEGPPITARPGTRGEDQGWEWLHGLCPE